MAIRSGSLGKGGSKRGTCTCRKKNRTLEKSQGGLLAAMHIPTEWFPLREDVLLLGGEVCAVLGACSSEEDRTVLLRGSAAPACFQPKALDTYLTTSPLTYTHPSPQSPSVSSKKQRTFPNEGSHSKNIDLEQVWSGDSMYCLLTPALVFPRPLLTLCQPSCFCLSIPGKQRTQCQSSQGQEGTKVK